MQIENKYKQVANQPINQQQQQHLDRIRHRQVEVSYAYRMG